MSRLPQRFGATCRVRGLNLQDPP